MTKPSSRLTTLVVLAGGEGSRMGRPKADLIIHGRPILQYLFERFAWAGPTMLVTAPGRERPAKSEIFGREVVDPVAGLGPLRGVLTALETDPQGRFLFVPVDMPGLEPQQLCWLVEQHHSAGGAGLMLRRMRNGRREIEPMPAVIDAEATAAIRERILRGQRSLYRLAADGVLNVVDEPENWPGSVWVNLNSIEDHREFDGK